MNPEMLKSLMPFLAGMGLPVMMSNIEKMHKLMTGGGDKTKKGQQPAGPAMGAVPRPAAMPPPVASPTSGIDPQKMQLIMQIMHARGMA